LKQDLGYALLKSIEHLLVFVVFQLLLAVFKIELLNKSIKIQIKKHKEIDKNLFVGLISLYRFIYA